MPKGSAHTLIEPRLLNVEQLITHNGDCSASVGHCHQVTKYSSTSSNFSVGRHALINGDLLEVNYWNARFNFGQMVPVLVLKPQIYIRIELKVYLCTDQTTGACRGVRQAKGLCRTAVWLTRTTGGESLVNGMIMQKYQWQEQIAQNIKLN